MPEPRWFFYFILSSVTYACLDTNQLVSFTRMRLLQVWKDFWADSSHFPSDSKMMMMIMIIIIIVIIVSSSSSSGGIYPFI